MNQIHRFIREVPAWTQVLSSMDESRFALSCVWCTEELRLCADSIRRRMYSVRAGGTTGVAGMSTMPQRPGEAQGQTVPGVADGAHRLEVRVAGDGGAPVRVSGVRPELRGFPPFAPPYVWYTYRLQAFVESLWGMMTVTDLAVVTGLGWDTVKKIIKARLEKGYGHPRLKHIRRLSVDEIYFGRHKKFYTLVIDLDTGQIIWVAKGRGGEALLPFWRALRLSTAKIEAVAMDMSAGYWAAVMEHLPEAAIPGVMKTKEPENQVTLVTQTICLAKKCLDLIVDAFHAAVVDPVLPPCKNATLMAEKSSGHLPHLADARFVGPSAPLVEERPHLAIGGLLPKQAQGFLEQIAG